MRSLGSEWECFEARISLIAILLQISLPYFLFLFTSSHFFGLLALLIGLAKMMAESSSYPQTCNRNFVCWLLADIDL
jgi:hypothetical protein